MNSHPEKIGLKRKNGRYHHLIFCFVVVLLPGFSCAQSPVMKYAREIIDTLTSPYMNGRGYVDSGEWKAAVFIRDELKKDSVLKFRNSYFQNFLMDANVFPGNMHVEIAGKTLVPGKDFLVVASSASLSGTFPLYKIEKDSADTSMASVEKMVKPLMKKSFSGKMIAFERNDFTTPQHKFLKQVFDLTQCFGAAGYVEFTNEKLTWTVSRTASSFCGLQVKDHYPEEKQTVTLDIDAYHRKNYSTQNVLAYLKGTSVPDSFIVFTAHYDHLGQMGDGTWFPGANDNASGTSMVLNLLEYFKTQPPKYSVAFIFFSGEEAGLAGSRYYVDHPAFPLSKIKFLVNLDIAGTGDDGIKVVNATEFPIQFDRLVRINNEKQLLKEVSPRGKAANSDHYPFYEKGVPCFFIYTLGGIAAYHDIYDRPETLPLTDYEDLFRLLISFTEGF